MTSLGKRKLSMMPTTRGNCNTMKKLIPKILERDITLYLLDGAKLFMLETYAEERAIFIEHSDGDVTIASWVEGGVEVGHLNISKDTRNSLANYLAIKRLG
jgi:hypothetical protein